MKNFYLFLAIGLFSFGSLKAQQKPAHTVAVSHVVEGFFYGETAPLRSYKPDPNAPNEVVKGLKLGYSPKDDWPLHESVNPNALPAGPDPAWQRKYTEATPNRNVSLIQDFAGLPYAPLNPPDPVMDVGPNHIIQMTNNSSGGRFQIWDKAGNSLVGPTQMDNFFATATGGSSVFGLGDPIVLYDQLADRWFMAEFCSGCNDIFILVSTTADPTSTWYAYKYTAPNFPDYLKFAVWPNAYTMTSNESGPSGVYAFDRTAMLAGNPATMQRFTVPDYPTIGFQASTPVGVEGPTPPPVGNSAYFMRMTDDAWSASIPEDRLEIWELDVDFAMPANSLFSGPTNLSTAPFDTELCGYTSFSCMDQPSGTNNLDPLREVLMYKVQYRNFGTHESIVCNHVTDVDNTDRGGIRWYELRRTGGGPWSIYQQGTYSPDSDDRWMAAININGDGQIGLLYNRSGTNTFPSIYCTGRNPGDPLGVMTEPETLIEAGGGSNNSIRYGDYSSLSVDPSDESTFWGTAEYNPSSQWGTRIAAFAIDPPTTPCLDEGPEGTVPEAVCEDITVDVGMSGMIILTAIDVDAGSLSECGDITLDIPETSFDCMDAGNIVQVTLTVTNVSNSKSDECTANVTVVDNILPTALCLNTTVEIEPDGLYTLQESDVYDAINSSDNCSISSVSFPGTTYTCDDAGQSFNVTVTVEDPSGNTDDCTATVTVEVGSSLPPEWVASDIGGQGAGSDYSYDPCSGNNSNQGDFTISTGGYNLIPQNSDNLAFATVPLCGNGGIQARIESVSGGYAGLMIRESSAPGAKMVAVYSNLTNLLRREIRTVTNGTRSSSTLFASFPNWLRLVRQGDLIRAFYRNSNGGSWILFHQAFLPMGNCVEMGLAVFTTDPSGDAAAVFGNVNYQSQGGQSLYAPNGIVWEVENPEVLKASVLPNPVRGNFTLHFSKPLPADGQAVLFNELGQLVSQKQLGAGATELDWDAGVLPFGLYFLEVAIGDGYWEVLKVVRQ